MQRNTVQRQIILETLKKMNTHPTIEEIYSAIHKEHTSISKTTVYRNLRQLADNGQIRKISLSDGLERYDGCTDRHYHFKCKACGCTIDVDMEQIAGINDMIREKHGFQVDEHDVVFTGICVKCKKV